MHEPVIARTGKEIMERKATEEEKGLLLAFFQADNEDEQVQILRQLFPELSSDNVRAYLHRTKVQEDTMGDRLMDIEIPADRTRFLATWPGINDNMRNHLEARCPYSPLDAAHRACKKRIPIDGVVRLADKSPFLPKFYRKDDLADRSIRRKAIIQCMQADHALDCRQAEQLVDALIEKGIEEKRLHGWMFWDDRRGFDFITQDEIDALLNGHQRPEAVPVPDSYGTSCYFREKDKECDAYDQMIRDIGMGIDPLYKIKSHLMDGVNSFYLTPKDILSRVTGPLPPNFSKPVDVFFAKDRLLSQASQPDKAKDKIFKYPILQTLWECRLSPAHDVSRSIVKKARQCQSFEDFTRMLLTPMEATLLIGALLENEIALMREHLVPHHSFPITNAFLQVSVVFRVSFVRNEHSAKLSDVVEADSKDFPQDTALFSVINVLDRMLAAALEKQGKHQEYEEPTPLDAAKDKTAKEESPSILQKMKQWISGKSSAGN